MSDVRTFRAASMQEALDLVRDELGPDAVILHTKQVERRRVLPWSRPAPEVEITAGRDVRVRPSRAAATSAPGRVPTTATGLPETPKRTSAAEILAAMEQRGSLDALAVEVQRTGEAVTNGNTSTPTGPSLERRPPQPVPAVEARFPEEFTARLDRIQRMLESLGRTSRTHAEEIPEELFQVYTELIDVDVQDGFARELVQRLRGDCTEEQLRHLDVVRERLHAIVRDQLRTNGPIRPEPTRRRVVALVGPTGVGKTTTIAKLAANFRLRDGIRMGLVTVDTYRIAAVEQLRTYAEIIDLPMKVVTSPPEMRRALEELGGLDLVLVDTAGRSPRDELQIQELKSLLAEARCDEVHLVLSLTSSLRGLETTARKFAPAGVTSMILTKLDEAAGMGALYSVARTVDLPISYLTTGQDVPDDIEHANDDHMARLVLGLEQLDAPRRSRV